MTFLKKEGNEYQNESDEVVSYLKNIGSLYTAENTQRLFMDDMIIIMDKKCNLQAIVYRQDNQLKKTVTEYCWDLKWN